MDNPCLSKGLIADFTNSSCYKQTSTIANYNYGFTSQQVINCPLTSYGYYAFSCTNSTYGNTYCDKGSGIALDKVFTCNRTFSHYSCPTSHPIKLNNSTCEYRENF